jgi:hypothetical protein
MDVSPENLTFFAGSFAVPAIMVVLNFAVRKVKNWYYTAGSDFLFTEMAFSFASAVLWRDMAAYIHSQFIRGAANTIFILMGLLLLLSWYWVVSSVEVDINSAIRKKISAAKLPQGKIFLAWALAVGFFAAEVMTFVYR